MNIEKRKRQNALIGQLKLERTSFEPQLKELSDYILPNRVRLSLTENNKGDRRNKKIIDSTASTSAAILQAGMMSGITSPARQWFRLSTPDPRMNEEGEVKEWLHQVGLDMTSVFLKSNLYQALPTFYGDMGTFGFGAIFAEEDIDTLLRFRHLVVGSYWIGCDSRGKPAVFYTEFNMTVRQIVERYAMDPYGKIDWNVVSPRVRTMWENGNTEAWIEVGQLIEPNANFNPKKFESKHKKFSSDVFELGCSDKYLSQRGFDWFPVLVGRWFVAGNDVYGTDCPGMRVLGDVKQLQKGEEKLLKAIDKIVDPPMQAPVGVKNASLLPGALTHVNPTETLGVRPIHEINLRIAELENKQEQVRQRIRKVFHEDLFLGITNHVRDKTAYEVEVMQQEKMTVMGPVLEQMNDVLNQLIDITFSVMNKRQKIELPPEAVQGQELKVEYISYMAQAQKAMGLGQVERVVGFITQLAAVDPNILHKLDVDQVADIYSDMGGTPPAMIRSDDAVAKIREQIQKAAAAQQQAMAAQQAVQTTKELSQTDTSGDNALTQLMGLTGGEM